jgi:hypothetical protein
MRHRTCRGKGGGFSVPQSLRSAVREVVGKGELWPNECDHFRLEKFRFNGGAGAVAPVKPPSGKSPGSQEQRHGIRDGARDMGDRVVRLSSEVTSTTHIGTSEGLRGKRSADGRFERRRVLDVTQWRCRPNWQPRHSTILYAAGQQACASPRLLLVPILFHPVPHRLPSIYSAVPDPTAASSHFPRTANPVQPSRPGPDEHRVAAHRPTPERTHGALPEP